ASGNGRVRFEGKWNLDPITINFKHVSGPDLHLDSLQAETEYAYASEVSFQVPSDGPVGLAQTRPVGNGTQSSLSAVGLHFHNSRSPTDAGIGLSIAFQDNSFDQLKWSAPDG